MTKHEQRVINFTHAVQGTHERYHSIDIVTYQNSRGLPCVAIWTHSTKNPSCNYSFKDEQQRENYINGKKEYELITFQSKARFAQQLKEKSDKIQAGCIVYTCWGYEQTNIDYYKVVKRTEKAAWFQPIKSRVTETGFMSGNSEPLDEPNGEIKMSRLSKYGSFCLRDGREPVSLYDGVPKSCSWYA
jgi:hypothetical protein